MKLAAIADLHVGLKTYSKTDPVTHLSFRELEVLDNLRKIITNILDKNINILVIAGDIYHSINISASLQNEVNKILFSAANKGLKIIAIDGNHDRRKLDTSVSPLEVFSTLDINNIIHSRLYKEVDIDNIKFVLLPTYATSDEVKDYLEKVDKSKPIIVIGHFSVAGAKMNDWLVAENEEYIDLNAFKKDNIKYVILGHLHKPQILNKKDPMIFYTGSLQRTDFNEENQEKGYWILDTNLQTHEFIPINTLNFYTIKDSLKEHSLSDIVDNIDNNRVNNAVIRVILEVNDEYKLSNEDKEYLMKYLTDLGASSISLKTQTEVTQRTRNTQLTEGLSIEKSIDTYFKDQPRSEERIKLAKEILTSLRENKNSKGIN